MKIYIACPTLRGLIPPAISAMDKNRFDLMKHGHAVNISYRWGDGCIARARNDQAREALASGSDWYIQWSDDISTDQSDALRTLIDGPHLVAGGLYAKSHQMKTPEETWTSVLQSPLEQNGPWVRALRLSGGFLAIKRDVLEIMGPNPFHDGIVDGTYISEDYSFCDDWRARGGQLWAHAGILLEHWGYIPFTLPKNPEAPDAKKDG